MPEEEKGLGCGTAIFAGLIAWFVLYLAWHIMLWAA